MRVFAFVKLLLKPAHLMRGKIHGLMGCGLLCLATEGWAEEALIAVASNFAGPMTELVKAFEADTSHKIHISYGASGKIYAQITHGAPFDAFFSADQTRPELLEQSLLTVKGSRTTYAIGQLALWSPNRNTSVNAQTLSETPFRKLAMANPKHAPYGVAAQSTLQALKLFNTVGTRLVYGENIGQTYRFAATGNADLAFVALSQVMTEGEITHGTAWIVPSQLYPAIKQDAVVLERGKANTAIMAFMTFIKTPTARDILTGYGYELAL